MNNNTKDKLVGSMNRILNDYSYYKTTKKFNSLIDFFARNLYNCENILEKIKNDLTHTGLDEKKLQEMEAKTIDFIKVNKKKYLNKVVQTNSVIYEYSDYFMWYPNNKINLKDEYNLLFPNKKIMHIHIDNQLRKKIENISIDDIKLANTIRIKVAK
jgi:hypothetical protein